LIIRRATIDDKDAIFEFIITAYDNPEDKIPNRWHWQFVDNPFVKKDNLPIWIAIDNNGKVICQSPNMIEPIKIGNEILIAAWGVDYRVLTSHEGLGIAPLVVMSNRKDSSIFMSLGMTQVSRKMNLKLGSIPIAELNSYILNIPPDVLTNTLKVRNINRFIKYGLGLPFLSKIISALINKWMSLKRRKYADLKSLKFIPIQSFGQEIDLLWDKISSEFDCAIVRNSNYLNWKYLKHPCIKYDVFLIKRKEEVVGYIILRKKGTKGLIVDFLFSTKEEKIIFGGLSYAVEHFLNKRVYDIRVATSVKEYSECIKKIGFPLSRASEIPLFYSTDPVTMNIAKTKRWLLSYGDCDQQQ